jgi:uncharacterized protein (DUF952 family)
VSVTLKLRWKRYLNELRFVHEEITLVEEINKDTSRDFQTYYERFCAREDIDLEELNHQHAQKVQTLYNTQTEEDSYHGSQLDPDNNCALVLHSPPLSKVLNSDETHERTQQASEYEMTQDEIEIHEAFHKVFRKIALKIHPDKLETQSPEDKGRHLGMFKRAKTAIEARKYFILLEIAEQLKVSVPRNYRQQIRWMKIQIEQLGDKLAYEQKTYNYIFAECETDADRDQLIRSFMTQVFGPQVFDT